VRSVSAADGREETPGKQLLFRTAERFGYRTSTEFVARKSHDAITRDGVGGEPQQWYEDVAKVIANIAIDELPSWKPSRISNRPTQKPAP
jgi:hypothetical protein